MGSGIRNPVMRFLVYSHLWLALGAAAQTWWIRPWSSPLMLAMSFCATLAAYNWMRLLRATRSPEITAPSLEWVRRHKRAVLGLVIAPSVMALGAALLEGWWSWALFIIGALSVALYLLPFGKPATGLRSVPFLKGFLVAGVWTLLTTGSPSDDPLLGATIPQFCFFLALAIAFDTRDLPKDPPALRTIPQVFGARASRIIATFLIVPSIVRLGVSSFVVVAMAGPEVEPMTLAQMWLPISGFLLAMILVARASPSRSEAYFSFWLDGTLILIPLLGWIGSYF